MMMMMMTSTKSAQSYVAPSPTLPPATNILWGTDFIYTYIYIGNTDMLEVMVQSIIPLKLSNWEGMWRDGSVAKRSFALAEDSSVSST